MAATPSPRAGAAEPFAATTILPSPVPETAAVETRFPFDDLVPSWNVDLPKGGSLTVEVQVKIGEVWSAWAGFGSWRSSAPESPGKREFDFGTLDVDTLKLKKAATAFRYRLKLYDPQKKAGADRVRLLAFVVSSSSRPVPGEAEDPYKAGPEVELDVEPRSQRIEQADYARDICSPTSLGMVLAFWGRKAPTKAWVARTYDRTEKIYGDWPFNMAVAGEEGLTAYVDRLNSLGELEAEVRAGHPVVTSISFKEGELAGAPIKRTRGHLFVVRGITAQGDFIVNDPAAASNAEVRRVYKRADIRKVWLENKRGLVYRIRP